MKKIFFILLLFSIFLNSCQRVRESAGVTRKSIDEFQIIENPPLVIPPDFNLMPPEQIEDKKLDDIDSELAKDILFGLEDQNDNKNQDISVMSEILNNANTENVNSSIREEINQTFARQKSSLGYIDSWEDQIQIKDSINESAIIRDKIINESNLLKKQKSNDSNINKKKRFLFF